MSAIQVLRLKRLLSWAVDFVEEETKVVEECHTVDGVWDEDDADVKASVDDARNWIIEARAELAQ